MNEEVLQDWEEQFGTIHNIEIGGVEYFYRELSVNEIEWINAHEDWTDVDIEDAYVSAALIYPQSDLSNIKAGYVSQLAAAIMQDSSASTEGILHLFDFMQSLREASETDVVMTMKAFILSAMPSYREEDLMQLTMDQLAKKVILSEKILSFNQAVNGIPSEEGVKLIFSRVDEESETSSYRMDEKTMKKLAAKARAEDREESDYVADLSQLDTAILAKMAGVPMANDPIARKLLGG